MIIIRIAAMATLLGVGCLSAHAFEPIISIGGQHKLIHPEGATDEIIATQEQTDGLLGILTLGSAAGAGPGPAIIHASRAEFWYVLEGTYEFHVGDKIFDGGPGTFLGVDAGQSHGYIAKTAGKLLVTYLPGGYEHFFIDWEKQGLVAGPELGALENTYGVTRP
ncbi:mannose-6-phosphate isomerase-like protein (cupin superfamily) [Devosia sp. UYZn731]|uniref:cupin domain-containing protein n=1 Tax=Devosia sp. UYZn731 TaxID=3156345 RepID=UPI00339498F1